MILFDLEAALREPDPSTVEQREPLQSRLAVSKLFAELRPLQLKLARIANAAELLQQVSKLAEVLAPLAAFHAKIKELTQLLEPMIDFRNGLRNVPPLETLDHELVQFSAACGANLAQLAASLEAAVILHERLVNLAAEFAPAKTLSPEFSALARSFEHRAAEVTPIRSQGNECSITASENASNHFKPSHIASKLG